MGEHVVQWHAAASGVHAPEVVLCDADPLVRGQSIPVDRLGVILRDAAASGVHDPEVVQRGGVSLLSTRPQCIDLLRLRLQRRTGRERHEDGDEGDSAGVTRHRLSQVTTTSL